MELQELSTVLSHVQSEDAKLRSMLSSLVSDFKSKTSLGNREHQERLDTVITHLSSLLTKRNELSSLIKSTPASPQLTDVTSQLQANTQVCNTYMQKLDVGARTLLSTIDTCIQGLSTHKHTPNPQDILSLAHRLRYTSFDRLGVLPSQPPAPQMWHMRGSALAAYNSQHAEAAAQTHQAADSSKPSSSIPLQFIPPKPEGWKAGDPIPLPPMPAGWKPGDPVDLADFESETSSGDDDMEVDEPGDGLGAAGGEVSMGLGWALNPELGWEVAEEPVSDDYSDDDEDE